MKAIKAKQHEKQCGLIFTTLFFYFRQLLLVLTSETLGNFVGLVVRFTAIRDR